LLAQDVRKVVVTNRDDGYFERLSEFKVFARDLRGGWSECASDSLSTRGSITVACTAESVTGVRVRTERTEPDVFHLADVAVHGSPLPAPLCSGKTAAGHTNWVKYETNGVYVDIGIESCGFPPPAPASTTTEKCAFDAFSGRSEWQKCCPTGWTNTPSTYGAIAGVQCGAGVITDRSAESCEPDCPPGATTWGNPLKAS
jgi:hypothetical protein